MILEIMVTQKGKLVGQKLKGVELGNQASDVSTADYAIVCLMTPPNLIIVCRKICNSGKHSYVNDNRDYDCTERHVLWSKYEEHRSEGKTSLRFRKRRLIRRSVD